LGACRCGLGQPDASKVHTPPSRPSSAPRRHPLGWPGHVSSGAPSHAEPAARNCRFASCCAPVCCRLVMAALFVTPPALPKLPGLAKSPPSALTSAPNHALDTAWPASCLRCTYRLVAGGRSSPCAVGHHHRRHRTTARLARHAETVTPCVHQSLCRSTRARMRAHTSRCRAPYKSQPQRPSAAPAAHTYTYAQACLPCLKSSRAPDALFIPAAVLLLVLCSYLLLPPVAFVYAGPAGPLPPQTAATHQHACAEMEVSS